MQLAAGRDFQQLVVRQAAPQEERQARGQRQVVDAVDGARREVARRLVGAEQEVRVRQHGGERAADAGVEVAFGAAGFVEAHQARHVVVGHRAAEGATRHASRRTCFAQGASSAAVFG